MPAPPEHRGGVLTSGSGQLRLPATAPPLHTGTHSPQTSCEVTLLEPILEMGSDVGSHLFSQKVTGYHPHLRAHHHPLAWTDLGYQLCGLGKLPPLTAPVSWEWVGWWPTCRLRMGSYWE